MSKTSHQNGTTKKNEVTDPRGGVSISVPNISTKAAHWLINHNNVFLFIPNIIGYTRILLAASSLYFMRWHPKYCTWLYIISCLLDAFDGMAARKFGQSMIILVSGI